MSDTNAVETAEPQAMPVIQNQAALALEGASVEQVLAQVTKIQEILKAVMKEGTHYGTIPGCGDKPTLLQPGAEKLCITFGIRPQFDVKERDLPNGHREYTVMCTMVTMSGGFAGHGIGVCSTMESRYRYRKLERTCPACDKENIRKSNKGDQGWYCWVKTDGCGATFDADDLQITSQKVGKVDHEDPADYFNTCAKIACKRAKVAATLNATGASDIFTQDLEDLKANGVLDTSTETKPTTDEKAKPATTSTADDTHHESDKEACQMILMDIGNDPLVLKYLVKEGQLQEGMTFADLTTEYVTWINNNTAEFKDKFAEWANA